MLSMVMVSCVSFAGGAEGGRIHESVVEVEGGDDKEKRSQKEEEKVEKERKKKN